MGVPRLLLYCASTLAKDKICLQEVRPWPSQREMATVRGGASSSRTQVQTLMNPLPLPRAPDGDGKSECTCCISLHITLLLWKIVCYFGTPWQPEWIAQGPKLVYLVSEAKPNERHLAQHLKNGKKLRESKNNQGLGNGAEIGGLYGLSRASCNPSDILEHSTWRQEAESTSHKEANFGGLRSGVQGVVPAQFHPVLESWDSDVIKGTPIGIRAFLSGVCWAWTGGVDIEKGHF